MHFAMGCACANPRPPMHLLLFQQNEVTIIYDLYLGLATKNTREVWVVGLLWSPLQ